VGRDFAGWVRVVFRERSRRSRRGSDHSGRQGRADEVLLLERSEVPDSFEDLLRSGQLGADSSAGCDRWGGRARHGTEPCGRSLSIPRSLRTNRAAAPPGLRAVAADERVRGAWRSDQKREQVGTRQGFRPEALQLSRTSAFWGRRVCKRQVWGDASGFRAWFSPCAHRVRVDALARTGSGKRGLAEELADAILAQAVGLLAGVEVDLRR